MSEIITAITELFCPVRAERTPMALSIASREAVIAAGGLSRLCELLRQQQVHPRFVDHTTKLQTQFEQASEFEDIQTRCSGSNLHATRALCEQAGQPYPLLTGLCLEGQAWVAPIVYRNHWAEQDRIAGDLTVYCTNY